MHRMELVTFAMYALYMLLKTPNVLPIFLNYYPEWTCVSANFTLNSTRGDCIGHTECRTGQFSTTSSDNTTGRTTTADDPVSFDMDCEAYASCGAGGLQYEQPAFLSAIAEWQLVCGAGLYFMTTVMTTCQFAGIMAGTIFWGHVSDRFGRKRIGVLAAVIVSLSGVLSGLSIGWKTLSICRFSYGFSVAGLMTASFSHIIEMIRADQRMLLRCVFNWGCARFIMTGICYWCGEWRMATIVLSLVFTVPLLLIMIFIVPESPHWLETNGKFEELHKVKLWIARVNGEKLSESAIQEMAVLSSQPESEKTHVPSDSKLYTTKDLFTADLRKRTVVYMVIWFTAALTSYANDLNSSTLYGDFYGNQFLMSAVIAVSKWVLYVVDTYVPRFRRRTLHQLPLFGVIVGFGAIVVLKLTNVPDAATMITVINIIATMFIEYTWDAAYLSSAEGYPTVVRAIGVGSCSFCARVGSLLSPQLVYLSLVWSPSIFLVVMLVSSVSLTLSIWGMPETKGRKLPDHNIAEAVVEDDEDD